jgi:hypothetical protein
LDSGHQTNRRGPAVTFSVSLRGKTPVSACSPKSRTGTSVLLPLTRQRFKAVYACPMCTPLLGCRSHAHATTPQRTADRRTFSWTPRQPASTVSHPRVVPPLIDAWGSGNRSMGGYYASPEPISTPLRLTAACVVPIGSLPLQRAEDKKATVIKQPVYHFRQSSAIRREFLRTSADYSR